MKNPFENKFVKKIYQIVMAILAIISVSITVAHWRQKITISKEPVLFFVDVIIHLIFTIDYVVRILYSKNKIEFIEDNLFDLLAIIPYISVFKLFRIIKIKPVAKFMRKLKFTKTMLYILKYFAKVKKFLKRNGLIYLLVFAGIAVTVAGIIIAYTEKISYSDGLWWAFVTATTVGYGDISPQTKLGRLVAAILMLSGIGTIGMITGTVATHFLDKQNDVFPDDDLDEFILNSPNYSPVEKKEIINFIQYIRSKRNN